MPQPIRETAAAVDLSPRFQVYKTVDASPSAATETVIATLALTGFADIAVISGVQVSGWAAFTVGTSGASVRLRIRQTDVNGTTVGDTGALTGGVSAGNLLAQDVEGFDLTPGIKQYAMTLTVASGAAASTVSALILRAIII